MAGAPLVATVNPTITASAFQSSDGVRARLRSRQNPHASSPQHAASASTVAPSAVGLDIPGIPAPRALTDEEIVDIVDEAGRQSDISDRGLTGSVRIRDRVVEAYQEILRMPV